MLKTLLLMNLFVLIPPGTNFVLTARNSLRYGFMAGCFSAYGIGLSITLHAAIALLGYRYFHHTILEYTSTLKILSALCLTFIALIIIYQALNSHKSPEFAPSESETKSKKIQPFFMGLLADLLNPYVPIFYISTYILLNYEASGLIDTAATLGSLFLLNASWFVLIALLFSLSKVQQFFLKYRLYSELVGAGALLAFALKLCLKS